MSSRRTPKLVNKIEPVSGAGKRAGFPQEAGEFGLCFEETSGEVDRGNETPSYSNSAA